VVSALSDAMFVAPALHSAGTFARRRNNTFFYHFNHQTKGGMYSKFDSVGSSYGQELDYVFGIPISGVWPHQTYHYTRAESVLSALLISYWANFVKDGNPNYPLQVEELLNTGKEAKRFKMVKWDSFDEKKKYLELDLKPRSKHNFRGHAASLWLSLVPKLENSGSYDSTIGHGVLSGPTWGIVRNMTSFPGVQQISHNDKVSPCQDTAVLTASESTNSPGESSSLNNVIFVSLMAGSMLFIVNSVILISLCYKRTPHRPRWDRTGDRGADSTECLNNECVSSNPETPHMVPNFNTPGRTSTIHRQSVPLSSFPPAVHECSVTKYRTYGNSYVGIPPPDQPDFSGVPLVADIPAPGPFNNHQVNTRARTQLDDSITC